jgi:hypothetical protein
MDVIYRVELFSLASRLNELVGGILLTSVRYTNYYGSARRVRVTKKFKIIQL